ncbi:DUF2163 domain-containing protein [Tropicibacter sp. R15_0]|uniref:DUF2163 domain-containing protein n=1 Tax=Tropicibacter sp. R15_0 TaxID=2821101 RepID=UPI001ADBAFD3|nr:DUF2163 domain-containing protein [Tropicibacter sp. R15_0]
MSAYENHLKTGDTSLCRCFHLTRADGAVMGFTDNNTDIVFDGVTYRADTALTASEASQSLGLSPDELEAQGALSSDTLTEADIQAGLYDGAVVVVWDVNFLDTSVRKILGSFAIGEITRGGLAFKAELRSLAAALEQEVGDVYSATCRARLLGDHQCRLDLNNWQGEAEVVSVQGEYVTVSGLSAFDDGIFDRGTITWITGANTFDPIDIHSTARDGDNLILTLWRQTGRPILVGDRMTVTAGCNRTAEQCRLRFDNLLNFRGEPHMPGETYTGEYAVQGAPGQTGGSRFA